jgi:hypothetical protein
MDPPDKSHLHLLRILEMLALIYLALSSEAFRVFVRYPIFKPVEACGRHSLEIFAAGCILALFGRLIFRTYGAGAAIQTGVNVIGIAVMFSLALYMEQLQQGRPPARPAFSAQRRAEAWRGGEHRR